MNPKSDLKIKQYFDMTDYHENDKKMDSQCLDNICQNRTNLSRSV